MRCLKVMAVLALAAMITTFPAQAERSYLKELFGCAGKVCVITDNFGGNAEMFEKAALEARRFRTKIRIRRHCYSGCVLFASRVREQVCLEPTARMGLHYGVRVWLYLPFEQKVPSGHFATPAQLEKYLSRLPYFYQLQHIYELPDYGDDITAWALEEDKMPYHGVYVLTREETLRYWKPCR